MCTSRPDTAGIQVVTSSPAASDSGLTEHGKTDEAAEVRCMEHGCGWA
jgi:hypothetical protein